VLLATVLALSSAVLHAGWNLILKTSEETDRQVASWGQFLVAGVVAVPVLLLVGGPERSTYRWLALSSLVHVVYITCLVRAYDRGDFSLAYPLSRGGGALIAAFGGVLFLGDELRPLAWVAIIVVVGGLMSLVGRSTPRPVLGWAVFTALAIGAYTVIDAHGSRLSSSGLSYALALMPCSALALSVVGVSRGRTEALLASMPGQWRRYAVAGISTTVAYALVLVAVRMAPVGYVSMLRESSVVLGALAGWLFLKELFGVRRLGSSSVILTGLVLLVAVNL
jgi:drug/metabolite transporter (DMT)-like permease